MPVVESVARVPVTPEVAFAVSQTTGATRMRWDRFRRRQELLDGARPGQGVRTLTVQRFGLRMVSEYASYRPPTSVGMRMTAGPWFFEKLGGGWRFEPDGEGTRAIWRYNFTCRPRWLALPRRARRPGDPAARDRPPHRGFAVTAPTPSSWPRSAPLTLPAPPSCRHFRQMCTFSATVVGNGDSCGTARSARGRMSACASSGRLQSRRRGPRLDRHLGDDAGHQLSLITHDASALVNPDVPVFVDDVHDALSAWRRWGWKSCIRSPEPWV